MYVYSGTPALIEQAQDTVAKGRGEDILTRRWDSGSASGTPITARRYLSFTVPGGDDDMFSSDLTDTELQVSRSLICSCSYTSASGLDCAGLVRGREACSRPECRRVMPCHD